MKNERRTHARLKKSVFFRIPKEDLGVKPSIDISLGGLLAEVNSPYDIDTRFNLELIIPNEIPIYCEARVAWIYPQGESTSFYKTGLQFVDISPKDKERLRKLIY